MNDTILEVDLEKLYNNISIIKNYTNKEIMPIIKAQGYGTYINKRVDVLNSFNIVGVAKVKEAIDLRKFGYKNDILILNQPSIDDIEVINRYNLVIGLSSKEFLNKANLPIRVHLEIETGMNRTGIKLDEIDSFVERIKENSNILVEGIYTHFSSADNDLEYTNRQLEKFKTVYNKLSNVFSFKYIHTSASSGIVNVNDDISNLVRPGISMYGYEAFKNFYSKLNVQPICRLKTKITYLKEIGTNEKVGYSKTFTAEKNMKIATIPIGYADGLNRRLSNVGYVIIDSQKCKIIGNICMDSCMIDVTELDVEVGDEVYIWDNDIIKVEDIASKLDTINYEILTSISDRVERKFINDVEIRKI